MSQKKLRIGSFHLLEHPKWYFWPIFGGSKMAFWDFCWPKPVKTGAKMG